MAKMTVYHGGYAPIENQRLEQFGVLAKFKYPTHQINFCTKEALKCLEYRGFVMENAGRESAKDNDLFFTCSLIDYIARKTKNTRAEIVNALGRKNLLKIYDLADIYHSDNIERVSDDYNSSMYYENPSYLLECYLENKVI